MTEADYLQILTETTSNSLAAYAIFMTLVGGYLIAAHNVGDKLDSIQFWIVNVLYVVSALYIVFAMVGIADGLATTMSMLEKLDSSWGPYIGADFAPLIIAIVNIIVVCASCHFMWRVRQKKGGSA